LVEVVLHFLDEDLLDVEQGWIGLGDGERGEDEDQDEDSETAKAHDEKLRC
jgi:hypothetical protein